MISLIPLKIRNAPTKLMKDEGYGKDYEMYPPTGGQADNESMLPEKLMKRKYLA